MELWQPERIFWNLLINQQHQDIFHLFSPAIQAAGIVEKNRKGRQFYYTLGPNYGAYEAGKLKRANE